MSQDSSTVNILYRGFIGLIKNKIIFSSEIKKLI